MSLEISPIKVSGNSIPVYSAGNINFLANKNKKVETTNSNPISRKGETMNLVKATFLGGLALGARLLWELCDGDFLFEHAEKYGTKLVDKNRSELTGTKRDLYRAGATVGVITAGISLFAILYTMLNTPKIAYNSKVNTFKKGKEMDVYIQANEAEKNIYTELSEKAKNANEEERTKLKEQYMQMQMAKNDVPDFVKK